MFTADANPIATNGVLPSPSARRIPDSRLYVMTIGAPPIMIRRYIAASGRIASGVCKRCSTGTIKNWIPTAIAMEITAPARTPDAMPCLSVRLSPAPNSWEYRIENPCVRPLSNPMNIQLNQSPAPSAASASTPMPFPTIIVSTTVYNC